MILTKYEDLRSRSLCCITPFPLLNTKFPTQIVFVIFVSFEDTFRYSQDLIAKIELQLVTKL